jgi:hypothetical protein
MVNAVGHLKKKKKRPTCSLDVAPAFASSLETVKSEKLQKYINNDTEQWNSGEDTMPQFLKFLLCLFGLFTSPFICIILIPCLESQI